MKKRLLAVLVAAVTAVSLLACGGGSSSSGGSGSADAGSGDAAASDMKVAMVTDYGDITDQSFNQTTYEACKAFTEANKIDFTYYKPEGDSTAEREAMIDKAVADGYNVLVLPGYAFAEAIVAAAETYPEVKFVALDVFTGKCLQRSLPGRDLRLYGRLRGSQDGLQEARLPRRNGCSRSYPLWLRLRGRRQRRS